MIQIRKIVGVLILVAYVSVGLIFSIYFGESIGIIGYFLGALLGFGGSLSLGAIICKISPDKWE